MIIYKSDNIERWNEVMTSDVDGTRFHHINPRTGEIDQAFEFNRVAVEILQDTGLCAKEMFDFIWSLQETFNKIEEVNRELRNKYNLSKLEAQNLQIYFHLNLPKRKSGHPMQLATWKKCRSKEQIWEEYYANRTDKIRVCNDRYIMKDLISKGKINFGAMLDFMQSPNFDNILAHCGEPVKKTES